MITLKLSQGKTTIIDDIDEDLTAQKWCVRVNKYAGRRENGTGRGLMLHRIILERILGRSLRSDEYVDHINGDTLDNRRINIRPVTSSQNIMNSIWSENRGVWQHPNGRWRARISIKGKHHIHLGYFDTREQALERFKEVAMELFGEYCYLSRPTDGQP